MAQTAEIKVVADTSQAERALGNLTKSLQEMTLAIAGAFTVRQFTQFADQITNLDNRLKAVTNSTQDYAYASEAVKRIAQETRTPLSDVGDIYGRLSLALSDVGYSQATVAETSKTFIQQVKLSGASMVEQTSAILQFGQAMTKGVLKWDDLKPLMTAAPGYVKDLQKALNMTGEEFMLAAHKGTLSRDKIIQATRSMADETQSRFDKMGLTFGDSMTLMSNAFAKLAGQINSSLGISKYFGEAVKFMTDNTGVFIGVIAGLTVAIGALLIPLIPAATAMAVLTGGAVIVGAVAAGGALGLMAQKMGLLGENTKKSKEEQDKINKSMKDGEDIKARRSTDQLQVAAKLQEELDKMNAISKAEAERYQTGVIQYEIQKQIAIEEEKMVAVGGHLNQIEKDKIATAVTNRVLAGEKYNIDKSIADLQMQIVAASILDSDQRKIQADLDKMKLQYSEQTYNKYKDQTAELIKQLQTTEMMSQLAKAGYDFIPSKSEIGQIGSQMIENQTERGIENAAMKRFQIANAMKTKEAVSNQEWADLHVIIESEKNAKILALDQQLGEARMRAAGVTNSAIIDSVKAQMLNVQMIQQGGVTGFQGVLGALDNVMSSMSAQNKKAFEAHKSLATAQAIISTYQAAAEAIAFPPGPPLSFIYVAGAIAAGMAQVAAIQSQTYSGKALGGSVMGNTPYIVGEKGPEMFVPAGSGTIVPNSELKGNSPVNVNFTIQANDAQGFDDLLIQRRGMITQFVRDAMQESGQRSRM